MVTSPSLLPPNRTLLEQALVDATDYQVNVKQSRSFKFNPSDAVIPWLIWEYGLGDIVSWVKDPKVALKDGVQFQRIRGTPQSIKMALRWAGVESAAIEEEKPGPHFAKFQVRLDVIPEEMLIEAIVALATLAAPVRSKLARIYNSVYRHFVPDTGLSDYSGVQLKPEGPLLAFGRIASYAKKVEIPRALYTARERSYVRKASYRLGMIRKGYERGYSSVCRYPGAVLWHGHRHVGRAWSKAGIIVSVGATRSKALPQKAIRNTAKHSG